jgi:hypothetical protein
MKRILLFIGLTGVFLRIHAQDCKGFYFMKNGEVQMTLYDKKGEANGKLTYTISDVNTSGGATTASFKSEMVNDKGKVVNKGSGQYKCSAGVLFVDAKVALPQENMGAYKDAEVKAEQVFIEYPSSMSAGQELKDVKFKMEIYNKGSLSATINFDEVNRKVIAKESVVAAASTWDCWKITYDVKFKALAAPLGIGIPVNMTVTEWFAPGFGIVRSETYNKGGKLIGSSVITSFTK